MPVPVTCGSCNTELEIDLEHVGWSVRCPKCSAVFVARSGGAPVPGGDGPGSPSPYAQTYTPPQGWSGNPSPPPAFSAAAPAAVMGGGEAAFPAPRPVIPASPVVSSPAAPSPGSFQEIFAPPLPAPPGARVLPQAVTAFVVGLTSLACFHILTGIPAMIIGYKARRRIRESGGMFGGDHLALAGIIMGAIGVILTVSDASNPFSLLRIFKDKPVEVQWDRRDPKPGIPDPRPISTDRR